LRAKRSNLAHGAQDTMPDYAPSVPRNDFRQSIAETWIASLRSQ
jgi:hypothetical protein